MAIDSTTLIRKRIGDDKKTETETFPLSNETTTVQLKYTNATVFSVYDRDKQSTPLSSVDDYQVDSEAGIVTLLYEPNDSKLVVVYYYYAFSDAEITELLESYGVNGACVEAIRWLIADSARLHDYSRGATSESLSQITKNLQDMLKDYTALAGSTEEDGVTPSSGGVHVNKRIHDDYRHRIDIPFDLSRDDSINT